MAAAEYYNATAAVHSTPQYSPYHQSPHQQPHELNGSPIPQYNLPQRPSTQQQQHTPPPPYHPTQQDQKPGVHFAPSTPPSQQNLSPGSNSGRLSFSNQPPQSQGHHLRPQPHHSHYAQHGSPSLPPQVAVQPPHMRPYMNANQSEYQLSSGYQSDPEQRRRRRHKHHDHQDDRDLPRDRPRKHRSKSNTADGFLGAAGGGLIGDLIFPGLGTVGGAVAGWIGGKNYGSHRQEKKERLHREQKEWEHKFRSRSHSGDSDRRESHDRYSDYKSYPRQRDDY